MPSVLFVCTANRFRSPLAAAIFKNALAENETGTEDSWIVHNSRDWRVGSAGTWAIPDDTVLPVVSETAHTFGIDLSGHRARRLDRELLAEYDLVLVMQASHREALLSEYPALDDKVYLFSNVVERGSYDMPDALGSKGEVADVISEMNSLIRRGLRYICVLATSLHNKEKGGG
jgi:protein-tyrosine-phosphatase